MTFIDIDHPFSAGSESFTAQCTGKSECIYTLLLVFEVCDYTYQPLSARLEIAAQLVL